MHFATFSLMQGARLHQVDGPSVFCFAHEWREVAADCTLDLSFVA